MKRAVLFGLSSLLAVSTHAATAPKSVYDTFSGSCEDFNDHVRSRGLKDPDGNTHVGTLGYTSCKIEVTLNQEGKLKIAQTQADSQTCLSADISKINIDADQIVTVMRWDFGNRAVSSDCRGELQRIDGAIRSHEAVHVDDCRAIREEAAREWAKTPHSVKVCSQAGKPAQLLVKSLHSRITEEIQDLVAKMSKEIDYRSKQTHERIGYGTSGIDCSRCE